MVYMVLGGYDNGSREDCSVFYEWPHLVTFDKAKAEAFELEFAAKLQKAIDDDEESGDPWTTCHGVPFDTTDTFGKGEQAGITAAHWLRMGIQQ